MSRPLWSSRGAVKLEDISAGGALEIITFEDNLDVFHVVGEEGLSEFFRECGDEMVRWSSRFGELFRSWGGFQVISEVTDGMVRCWSIAKRAVRLGAG